VEETAIVLVVDDEPRVLDALEAVLAAEFRVLRAEGGEQALRLLPGADVAVIVTEPGARICTSLYCTVPDCGVMVTPLRMPVPVSMSSPRFSLSLHATSVRSSIARQMIPGTRRADAEAMELKRLSSKMAGRRRSMPDGGSITTVAAGFSSGVVGASP